MANEQINGSEMGEKEYLERKYLGRGNIIYSGKPVI